jgi:hypothetical protein
MTLDTRLRRALRLCLHTAGTSPIWRYGIGFVLTLLTACAALSPGSSTAIPGASPRTVVIQVTSGLQRTPLPPEEVLADPVRQNLIAQCERAGGKRCRESTRAVDARTTFVQGQDHEAIVLVILGGLEPNRLYEVSWRIFDPQGQLQARIASPPYHAPPDNHSMWSVNFWQTFDPAKLLVGRWRVEIAINGRVESERFFEVVPPTSQTSPRDTGEKLTINQRHTDTSDA